MVGLCQALECWSCGISCNKRQVLKHHPQLGSEYEEDPLYSLPLRILSIVRQSYTRSASALEMPASLNLSLQLRQHNVGLHHKIQQTLDAALGRSGALFLERLSMPEI